MKQKSICWRTLRLIRWTTSVSLSALLVACGGGGGGASDPPPPPPVTATRVQDSRSFSPPIEASLPALDDSWASTDRWTGVLEGAAYRIEVPRNWNGSLVVWARGYWIAPTLYIENPPLRRHFLQNGYAWAVSSYTRNYYDVNVGIEDSNRLVSQFQAIAAARGRVLAAPRRVYIGGWSMGGHVAAAAVEDEVLRDARTPVRYDGALALCPSLGEPDWYDYMAAYQLAMQQLLGFAAEGYPSQTYAQNVATMKATVVDAVNRKDLSQPAIAKLYALMEQLSGGARPFYREGWQDLYHHNILFGLMNGDPTLEGILAVPAMDTRSVEYRFSATLDADARQFNDSIRRLTRGVDSNPRQQRGLRWLPLTTGQLIAPVMSLQTLGDLTVPIDLQVRYRQRVLAQGQGPRLTQRLIRDVGHCSFTIAEMAKAFDDLVAQAERGVRPAGDDLLDTARWRGAQAGCAHTDNRVSPEDRADPVKRAGIQAAYPACR